MSDTELHIKHILFPNSALPLISLSTQQEKNSFLELDIRWSEK